MYFKDINFSFAKQIFVICLTWWKQNDANVIKTDKKYTSGDLLIATVVQHDTIRQYFQHYQSKDVITGLSGGSRNVRKGEGVGGYPGTVHFLRSVSIPLSHLFYPFVVKEDDKLHIVNFACWLQLKILLVMQSNLTLPLPFSAFKMWHYHTHKLYCFSLFILLWKWKTRKVKYMYNASIIADEQLNLIELVVFDKFLLLANNIHNSDFSLI